MELGLSTLDLPIYGVFSGASKKSWPQITEQNQLQVKESIEKALKNLDPAKHVIVTGGTEYGVDKIVHELASKMGFSMIGTITENTVAEEVSPLIKTYINTSINWFGMSRPVLEKIVQPHGGIMIVQGGGAILKEHIEVAKRLGIPSLYQLGPEGAGHDVALTHPEEAFSNSTELVSKMKKLLKLNSFPEKTHDKCGIRETLHLIW